jgi:hypothetical protein
MLDALESVAGHAVRNRVRFVTDPTIAGIVANWPAGRDRGTRCALGLKPDPDFASIIRQYIADCEATPAGREALKGMAQPGASA